MAAEAYQLSIRGHDGAGNQWCNVLHYKVTTEVEATHVQIGFALAVAWEEAFKEQFLACCSDDIVINHFACRHVGTTPSGTAIHIAQAPVNGSRGAVSVTLNVGPQVAFYPEVESRAVGKLFIPGIAAGDVVEGNISGALATAVFTFMNSLIAEWTYSGPYGATVQLVIYRRATHTMTKVVFAQIRSRLGSQRRRTLPTF